MTGIRNRGVRRGLLALVASTMLMGLAPSAARAETSAPSTQYVYPSAASTVIASVGFLNGTEIGYFWSAARGDSVTQSFAGPASITKAGLKVTVVQNVLNSGAHVDWSFEINGTPVGRFRVNEGFFGPITLRRSFPAITGPNYSVVIRVTNEVAGGQGSITLAYAGAAAHALILLP